MKISANTNIGRLVKRKIVILDDDYKNLVNNFVDKSNYLTIKNTYIIASFKTSAKNRLYTDCSFEQILSSDKLEKIYRTCNMKKSNNIFEKIVNYFEAKNEAELFVKQFYEDFVKYVETATKQKIAKR